MRRSIEVSRRTGSRLAVTLAAAVLLAAVPAGAAEDGTPASETPAGERKWGGEVLPYVWLPAQAGTVQVRGKTAAVDVSIKDGLDLVTSGNAFFGTGSLELRYDRFGFYADAFGGYAEDSVGETITGPHGRATLDIDADLKLKLAVVDFAANYRLGQWSLPARRRPLTLDVIAGGRYYYIESRLKAAASVTARRFAISRSARADKTIDWADPLVGVRWEVPLLDCLSLDFRGDIGGFGAGSDLSWGLLGGLRYWLSWHPGGTEPWLGAGYKMIAFDYEASPGNSADLQFRGPFGGIGVRF